MKLRILEAYELSPRQKAEILNLWNNEYPKKLYFEGINDLENYLKNLANQRHYFLQNDSEEMLGWGFTFSRDSERWFAIILDTKIHGMGYGTVLLNRLKEEEESLSGWLIDHSSELKQNGAFYLSPLKFYQKNGFQILPDVRLESEKISAVKIEWSIEKSSSARTT